MPEYTLAGIAWLSGALILAAGAGILRQRRTWVTLVAFLAFTVVFDAILTGLPIVTYDEEHLSGLRLGTTPVEDYLYGAALCLTAIATYEIARRRGASRSVPSASPADRGPAEPAGRGPDPARP